MPHGAPHERPWLVSRNHFDPERAVPSGNASPSESLKSGRPTSLAGSIASTARETALLAHFRYFLAPWLDIDSHGAFFGIQLFLLARDNRTVTSAILSIAAKHLYLKSAPDADSQHLECCLRYRQEAESRIPHGIGTVPSLVRVLLLLESFLGSDPRYWRDIVDEVVNPSNAFAFDAMEEALRWTWLRIGMTLCQRALPSAIAVTDT
jgi:hypothetical protein